MNDQQPIFRDQRQVLPDRSPGNGPKVPAELDLARPATSLDVMNKIVVRVSRNYLFLDREEIDWIGAERNYTRIHCRGRSFLICQTLGQVEKRLHPGLFVRINRSVIVNVGSIRSLRTEGARDLSVILASGQSWRWGRRFRRNLQGLIHSPPVSESA